MADRARPFAPRTAVRATLYRALFMSAHALYKAGNGCLLLAAGLLRRDELQSASVDQYRSFNVSAFDVDSGLSPAEQMFYSRFLRPNDRILLAGCGTGRDLIALQQLGHDVTGLEPSPEIVGLARQHLARRGISALVRTGFIQNAELGGRYDAIIFSNGCYSLLQGSAVRIAALSRVAEHLTPSGRIIVSYHPGGRQSRLGRWLTKTTAWLSGSDWVAEPGDTFARDPYVPGLIRYHHAFVPSEFARECEAAGLTLLADEMFSEGYCFAAADGRPALV
jgi:SAM-dependent methyltransferase